MGKSIADFVAGKIRRAESEATMRFVPGGSLHDVLGPAEGTLIGPAGALAWYERGIVLADGSVIAFADMERVALIDAVTIELSLAGGVAHRINGSDVGTEIVYASLRWIGNAVLRRKLAD